MPNSFRPEHRVRKQADFDRAYQARLFAADGVLIVNAALAPYPDLVVSALSVEPPGAWAPGSAVTLHWDVQNAGTSATPARAIDSAERLRSSSPLRRISPR